MKISVIVPNYNHAQYLDKRIESILNQTYQDFELIILDDCSSDNSRDVIELYRNNSKVSAIIYNTENSGSTFRQWKKGFELAKGEYIWIAESDDWAQPCFLEQLINSFDESTTLAFCQSKRFRSETEIVRDPIFNYEYLRQDGLQFITNKMLDYNMICNASMVIFKKKYIDKMILEKIIKMLYCGDWIFWIHLASQGNVVEYAEIYNYFRQHSEKVTSKAQKKGLDFIEGVEVLKYAEQSLGLKPSISALNRWSKLWLQKRKTFDEGVQFTTYSTLVSYHLGFLFLIPLSLFKMKIVNLKHRTR